jgi:predicted TIM-barrel fold metal-dependent hydrolase
MAMTPAEVRAQLDHPVIDSDGHVLEYIPAALPYLRESLGADLFGRYVDARSPLKTAMSSPTLADRQRSRVPQSSWWGSPVAHVRDLATSLSPRLLHERMGELGMDYAVLYPTNSLTTAGVADEEMRRGLCHGFNEFLAAAYGPFSDRITVAGLIPMHTPEEAIAELEHCQSIGLKVVGIPQGVLRPIESPAEPQSPWLMPGTTHWWDHFGLDSAYDYDAVWAKFAELHYAVTVHGGLGSPPTGWYTSVTSWMANHIGSFAGMMYPVCKSMYLGGVTRRFPDLPIAFLECGVGWACTLLAETVEHWEKRNIGMVESLYDPSLLDIDKLIALMRDTAPELIGDVDDDELGRRLEACTLRGVPPEEHDEWAAMGIEKKQDFYDLFVPNLYFGCEADDRTAAFAFSKANAFGATLKVMFSSDISHFDVPDFLGVMPEAYGLVRKELMTSEQFRDFTFTNVARLYHSANPSFFDGTAIEAEVGDVVGLVEPSVAG